VLFRSPASVFDPISARIAKDLGYEMGMFAGSVASLTVLGAPDVVVLTLSEFADQAQRICRAEALPLLVDADHGYGNALNVMRTVEELEAAGIAGLSIEDTVLPTSFGKTGKPELLSVEEGVGKMRAALAARSDPNLVIAGRTSAAILNGIEDAIARAKAYEATGVDAIFLVGLKLDQFQMQLFQLRLINFAFELIFVWVVATGKRQFVCPCRQIWIVEIKISLFTRNCDCGHGSVRMVLH